MAEGKQSRNGEIERVSMNGAEIPRDLLQRFFSGNNLQRKFEEETECGEEEDDEEEEEIELSLGLSLNGRFGVDPRRSKKLSRSSSISDFFLSPARRNGGVVKGSARLMSSPSPAGLARALSLPTGAEEEWKRKKELQSLRRMEAKRKRRQKQQAFTQEAAVGRDRAAASESCEDGSVEKRTEDEPQPQPHPQLPRWTSSHIQGEGGGGEWRPPPSSSPASAVSQGSGSGSSSFVSDFDSQTAAGTNKLTEPSSSPAVAPPQIEPKPAATDERLGVALKERTSEMAARDVAEKMPYVSTTGEGPNGRRIEGFLYRFRKGEEVRIVCVCHGNFLSPAEFVRHAGGGDVAHPLRHIVVNPTSLL